MEFTLAASPTTGYAGYLSNATYDLTEFAVYVQIVDAGTGDQGRTANLMAQIDSNNNVQLYRETLSGTPRIQAAKKVAGTESYPASVAVTTDPYWLRLREASGTCYWEYSTTGLSGSWTVLHSESDPITLTAITVQINAGTWQAIASPGVPKYDNLNTPPGGNAFQDDAFQGDAFQEPTVTTGDYPTEVAANSPVAYWRLGETSGTVAADEIGSNDGDYLGGYTLGQTGALVGDSDVAANFNGSTGRVEVTPLPMSVTDEWTIEAWVKPDTLSPSTAGCVCSVGTDAGGYALMMSDQNSYGNGGSRLVMVINQWGWSDSGYNFANTTDYVHVVLRRNPSTGSIAFFVNGDAVGPRTAPWGLRRRGCVCTSGRRRRTPTTAR